MNFIDKILNAMINWFLHLFKNENTRNKLAKIVNLEIITYLIAGVLTTIVNWIVSYIMNDIIHMQSATVISIISWVVSVAFAYWINSSWVFKSKYAGMKKEMEKIWKFVSSRLITGVLEVGGMWLFCDVLLWAFWPVKIVISVVVVILNYVFSKLFVFLKKNTDEGNK
ncbi:MAG: GtrA family protein [Lachnospiraceae bacterium]|nr:GtrA family protein [Lachnospiraceae bacterium]